MNRFITENTFTTQSSCKYPNIFAYCQIKAGHQSQSVKCILQFIRIFPSRYNTASWYLIIILQLLNSLSIQNCKFSVHKTFKLTEIVEFTSAFNKLKIAIIWISNLSIFSVPDESLFRRVPRTVDQIYTFLLGDSLYVCQQKTICKVICCITKRKFKKFIKYQQTYQSTLTSNH